MIDRYRTNWPHYTIVLLVLYWSALAVATHLPAVVVPKTQISDKSIHFIAFFGLTVLFGATRMSRGAWGLRIALAVAVMIAIYAALDELSQGLVPGRYPDLGDWYYDVGGSLTAIVMLSIAVAAWRLTRPSPSAD